MRKQQQVWLKEHLSQATLPDLAEATPSGGVVRFVGYLKDHNISSGKAVDIGCGKGRNAVYLAEQGFEVQALDYIKPAIEAAKKLAKSRGQTAKITFKQAQIDESWPFADSYFDVAVDCFSSIDIETLAGREICRNEMFRTLKPGGLALVSVVAADDEWEQRLIAKSPGPEPNSTLWPQNGKFQKDYNESELKKFYQMFKIVELQKISKPAFKLGKAYTATNFWLVLQKTNQKPD